MVYVSISNRLTYFRKKAIFTNEYFKDVSINNKKYVAFPTEAVHKVAGLRLFCDFLFFPATFAKFLRTFPVAASANKFYYLAFLMTSLSANKMKLTRFIGK